jgi:hypothetical protein
MAIYGVLALRQLDGVGFSLRLRLRDFGCGLREFLFYVPIAIPIGLRLGFLYAHAALPSLEHAAGTFLFTFFFIAVPEELFFAAGCKIFWSDAADAIPRSSPPQYSSACLIGTSAQSTSTGAMSYWPLWQASFMVAPGIGSAA